MSRTPNIDRRKFMKTASLGAAALSVAGLDAASALADVPAKWDDEADVLVIGYGGAGAVTAIEAADAGAKVLVLEKNPANHHICNTNINGGVIIGPTDVELAFKHVKICMGDTVDDEMCRLWAVQTSTNIAYLKKLANAVGLPSEVSKVGGAEFPDLPGAAGITTWRLKSGGGDKIFEIYDQNVKIRKNIRVQFSSPAKKIVQGKNKEVLGVIAEHDGREIAVRGRRATVLASGGYEFNDKLKLNSLYGNPRYFYGSDSNTGDGLLMAMAAGAELWHMNWTSQHYGFQYKDFPIGFSPRSLRSQSSFMIVDQHGKRFFDEGYTGHSAYMYFCYMDPVEGTYPRIPAYLIFDETVRTMGQPLAVSGGGAAKYNYHWSQDQSAEIDKGWIMKAYSIADLAKAINARQGPNPIAYYDSRVKMDPEMLMATVAAFNTHAGKGSDTEFGRHSPTPTAISNPPFYATEVWPVGPNTQGGPKFDPKGRVVDPYGKPIPRLYKCGELGSIYGQKYPAGGGNNAEILGFGRIVGQNAAKEMPQRS